MNGKYEYKDEPLQLVGFDEKTGKLIVGEGALAFLRSIQGYVGVVAVAGFYRTGKSYLLNRMILNRKTGFGVGGTVNACTKGIWIWGRPLQGRTVDGQDINILVVDTEGLGSTDVDESHDSRVFSLAILLSSLFIYNSVGSIDENAISNLSLIVNITKNIHVKANTTGEEPGEEDYAKYFPSFIWLVRDFSLQLVDTHGDPITSKEYLEMALAPAKGFSDAVEEKNRIRRLLTSFFSDRDCITMVRPLKDEKALQQLEEKELDELRPEFYEQVINLRKVITGKMKPKQMHGKILTGQMYAELVKTYVESVNSGAVPNIESSWVHVCRQECMKALFESVESYEDTLQNLTNEKLPLSLEDLKAIHVEAKQKALAHYREKGLGDVKDDYEKELLQEIKSKYETLKINNETISDEAIANFLANEYKAIDYKVRGNEYKTFYDFEKDLKRFAAKAFESAPPGPNQKTLIMEFLQKASNDVAGYFIKALQNEADLTKSIANEREAEIQRQLSDLRTQLATEKNSYIARISKLESSLSEKQLTENTLNDTIEQLTHEKETLDKDYKEKLSNEILGSQRQIEALKEALEKAENKSSESERKQKSKDSDYEREKALMSQKITQYESKIADLTKREKSLYDELAVSRKDHQELLRETSQKLEGNLKALQAKIDKLQAENDDYRREVSKKTQELELTRNELSTKIERMNSQLEQAEETVEGLKKEARDLKQKLSKKDEEAKLEKQKATLELSAQVRDLEDRLKEKEDNLKNSRNKTDKDRALLEQKVEFLEIQVKDYESKHNDLKKAYDTTLRMLEDMTNNPRRDDRQIGEIQELYEREKKKIEEEYEKLKKQLVAENNELKERNNELELKAKLATTDYQKQLKSLREDLNSKEQTCRALEDQNRILENQKAKILKDAEDRFSNKIRTLEATIQELKRDHSNELADLQQKNEFSIGQLRAHYADEKEIADKRLKDEKTRAESRYNQMVDEYEERLREDQEKYEGEIESLKEELHDLESSLNSMQQQYEHELTLKQQNIDQLEAYNRELKEQLTKMQDAHNGTIEQHLNNFNAERLKLIQRIETQNQELAAKDKEIFSLNQIRDQVEAGEKAKIALQQEKANLLKQVEEQKAKVKGLSDEFMEKSNQYERDLALGKQQVEFLTKKNEEIQQQVSDVTKKYEDRIKSQKQDIQNELNEKFEKAKADKEALELKLENYVNQNKENENNFSKQIAQLEKEKAVLEEKLRHAEMKRLELEKKLEQEIEEYEQQISQLKEANQNDKKALLIDLDKARKRIEELDHQYSELNSDYERDKALWQGKAQFLEHQKEQAKNDLADAQRKFELTIMHLQKHRDATKEDSENQSNLITSIEKRYQTQIQQLKEAHERHTQEMEDKNKKLERELKTINEKLLLESYEKQGNRAFLEKKVSELEEREKALLKDIEFLKEQRDQKALEYQRMLENEKAAIAQRLSDSESRLRESEIKKNSLIFEHEKEKAKWNLERDHLMNQKAELQEQVDKFEKKKELLVKENEKLRGELKSKSKNSLLSVSVLSSYKPNILNASYSKPTYEKSDRSPSTSRSDNKQD